VRQSFASQPPRCCLHGRVLRASASEEQGKKPHNHAALASGGGEGFEPSIRLTTDNGFRDHAETTDLQGLSAPFASPFASLPAASVNGDRDDRLSLSTPTALGAGR
jgi:hypothetical protein